MTYPRPLRLVHWTVAALVTCQLALAVVLTQLRSLSYGQLVLSLHRQLGLVILLLIIARLVMSRRHKVPSYGFSGLPPWQVRAAALVHGGFVVLLMAQPVIGILLAWARGDTVGLLGLVHVAAPVEMSDGLREQLMTVHAVTAIVLFGLCMLHVGAVVFNRVVRRISVIDRMLPPVSSDKLVNRVSVGGAIVVGVRTSHRNGAHCRRQCCRNLSGSQPCDGSFSERGYCGRRSASRGAGCLEGLLRHHGG